MFIHGIGTLEAESDTSRAAKTRLNGARSDVSGFLRVFGFHYKDYFN
jgi:hypothetical protein